MDWEAPQDESWRGTRHRSSEAWRGDRHAAPSGRAAFGPAGSPSGPGLGRLRTIYRAPNPAIADLIRGLLDDHQIPHVRLADAATGIFGVPQHLEIAVPEEFGDDALALIREFVDDRAGLGGDANRPRPPGMAPFPLLVALALGMSALVAWLLLD